MQQSFDAIEFANELTQALESSNARDLVIVPGAIEALQRGIDEEGDGGEIIGVATWVLGELYQTCSKQLSSDNIPMTVGVLVACPGHLRAWNIRKQSRKMADELHFNALILRRAPKATEAWAHRRWLLRESGHVDVNVELEVVKLAMSRAFANYYAGVHFVLYCTKAYNQDMLSWCREFLSTHPRDATAWSVYRTALQRARAAGIVDFDLDHDFVGDMVKRYQASQAIDGHAKWWAGWRTSSSTVQVFLLDKDSLR